MIAENVFAKYVAAMQNLFPFLQRAKKQLHLKFLRWLMLSL